MALLTTVGALAALTVHIGIEAAELERQIKKPRLHVGQQQQEEEEGELQHILTPDDSALVPKQVSFDCMRDSIARLHDKSGCQLFELLVGSLEPRSACDTISQYDSSNFDSPDMLVVGHASQHQEFVQTVVRCLQSKHHFSCYVWDEISGKEHTAIALVERTPVVWTPVALVPLAPTLSESYVSQLQKELAARVKVLNEHRLRCSKRKPAQT